MLPLTATARSAVTRGRLLKSCRLFNSKTSSLSVAGAYQTHSPPMHDIPEIIGDRSPRVDISTNSGKLVILTDLFDRPTEGDEEVDAISSRNRYIRNRNHVASLMDALVTSGHLKRADIILPQAHEILSPEEFALVRNDFLQMFVKKDLEDHKSISYSINWLQSSVDRFPGIPLDSKSYAIIIAAACRMPDLLRGNEHISDLMKQYKKQGGLAKDILQHVELFTFRDARRVAMNLDIDEDDLPADFRTDGSRYASPEDAESMTGSVTEALSKMQQCEAQDILNRLPPDVFKSGVDSLTPVDSHGIKLLRSALKGVAASKRPQLPVYASNPDADASREDEGFLHLEEQLSLLPDEDQTKYRDAFESYNMDRQLALETLALESARERWKYDYEQMHARGEVRVKNINHYLWEWHTAMTEQLQEELKRIDLLLDYGTGKPSKAKTRGAPKSAVTPSDRARMRYGAYLKLVDPAKLSVITILELLKMHSSGGGGVTEGIRTTRAVLNLGRAIEMEYNSEQLLKSDVVQTGFRATKSMLHSVPEFKRSLAVAKRITEGKNLSSWRPEWPDDIKAEIGSTLISILMHVARITVSAVDPVTSQQVSAIAPAFTHTYQYTGGLKLGVLKLHRDFVNKISREPASAMLHPQQLPMLVRPKPWVGWNEGAYYYSKTALMRTKDSAEQTAYIKEACRRNDLESVYEGLDVLGSAAWIINTRVFEVLAKVWNTGEEFLEIPTRYEGDINFPLEPPKDADPAVRRDWARVCKLMIHERRTSHSQRCDVNYKLEISRAFLGERIFFPHNIDFRGRAYAIPPHLNHLGNDMCRGLLMFWEGKPLGERGLRWLKIHLANVCGFDKADFQSRVQYADDKIQEIFDSADCPLDGRRWWMQASDPWQCLAACFELADALRSPDPYAFRSRLPVHQDGTCNGLQHYAALGGDIEGARQVNLEPGDKPQDIYTHVASRVHDYVKQDAENGHEVAKILVGKVSRKVVKQSVMTNVYGVTYIGARAQILGQLKDTKQIDERDLWRCAAYLTTLVFKVVRNLFNGAHLIQDWLAECAKRISKSVPPTVHSDLKPNSSMTSVIWTTPLGLPVVQPYREIVRKQVGTNLQSVFISDPYAIHPVNSRKQVTAFPPNFIHSLDATHMLLSALACGRNGLTFAAVHDSYWTHAADIDRMNAILRDAFIKLHEGDLVAKLKEEFERRYAGYMQFIEIDNHSPEAKRITEWRKELRTRLGRRVTVRDEIEEESKRKELLNSNDPINRAEGAAMTTPLSIIGNTDIEELKMKRVYTTNGTRNAVKSTENENGEKTSEEIIRETLGIPDSVPTERQETAAINDSLEASDETMEEHSLDDEVDEQETVEDTESTAIGSNIKVLKMRGLGIFYPLTFPPVPPKGAFDVKTLRNSLYFFS
ncbi:hypothetical protein V1527DRAFT_467317 [Lipomyces starkeyi]